MKFISIILAVFMLWQAAIPCDDVAVFGIDSVMGYTASPSNHNHDGNAHQSDACSPLCVCSCCHSPIVMTNWPFRKSLLVYLMQDKFSYYQDFYPNGVIYSIWKPPQSA